MSSAIETVQNLQGTIKVYRFSHDIIDRNYR
jgi:hypothetical protein